MQKFYYIFTYGCQMNVHESEKLAGILVNSGYLPTEQVENADCIVFNTCCIRDTAEKKIYGNIGSIKKLKENKPSLIVAVVGCMSQQDGTADTIKQRYPFVNIVMGTADLPDFGQALAMAIERNKLFIETVNPCENTEIREDTPVFRTSGTNAWVNIMYGCNNFCTYCIVPYVRGRERSRAPGAVLDEIHRLLDEGYKEITLLGQNVDSYRYEDKDFAYRLEKAGNLTGKYRLRFMTSHPKDFHQNILDIIKDSPNICNNIHLPVQSGSNRILQLMNRKYTRERYLELIDQIRATIPDCGITSDVMTGFPTETEEDFAQTLSLVERVKFSTAFTFVYSPRKGTAAALMEQLSPDVKKERITRLVALQNALTREGSKEYIGTVLEVLAEDVNPKNPDYICGRTGNGRLVNFKGEKSQIGDFINVKIHSVRSSSLWGEIHV